MENAGLAETGRFVGWKFVAMVATLAAAALFAPGRGAPAALPGDAAAQASTELAAGVISTVAGGVGGLATATTVPVAPCNVVSLTG
jgi:hypothetical protein